MNNHQALIVNNFCKHRQKIGEKLVGEEPGKAERRWNLLTQVSTNFVQILCNHYFSSQSNDYDPQLQLLLSLIDLLSMCAEGDNIFIESVCQTLLPIEEILK